MKNIQNKKKIQIMIFVLIAVITLGVGYAAITAINLMINGNATGNVSQENFKVKFTTAAVTTGTGEAGIDTNDPKIATFNVTGLTKAGDQAVATYTVLNDSPGIGASISLDLTNSNTDYYTVTESIADTELQAGDSTTVTITVTLTKTILDGTVSTSITGTLTASPLENANATGTAGASETRPVPNPYTYTIDGVNNVYINTDISSWTRKYNNFTEAKTAFGHPGAIAHITNNGVVSESYVAFERNDTVYYLKGRIDESSLQEKPVYEANVAELKRAFPDWETTCTDYTSYFHCASGGFRADAYTYGHVYAYGDDWSCYVSDAGHASCYS